jgi:Mn2+/Fe2+ NRAMP family transporter
MKPANSLWTLENKNKKKSAGARSHGYGRCWITWICLAAVRTVTVAAVCTGTLSKGNHHSLATIAGLFSFRIIMNPPRSSMMYSVFTVIPLACGWCR